MVPVRDAVATIGGAIESVLAQTDPDLELIVVDDGSADGTDVVVERWRRRDRRLASVRVPRLGVVGAANEGLLRARGEFVARLDADDVASHDRLERQLDLFARDPTLTVADGGVEIVRADGEPTSDGMRRYEAWINGVVEPQDFDRQLLLDSPVVNSASTARRDALIAVGGVRHGPFPEDYDLWLRLHSRGARFRKVPATLVTMRDHRDRLTRSDPRFRRDAFRRARLAWLERGPLRTRRAIALWGGGPEGRPWVRMLRRRGHHLRAVLDDEPRRVGATRAGDIPVTPSRELSTLAVDLCLVAVPSETMREEARAAIRDLRPDWREGRDWWAVR